MIYTCDRKMGIEVKPDGRCLLIRLDNFLFYAPWYRRENELIIVTKEEYECLLDVLITPA